MFANAERTWVALEGQRRGTTISQLIGENGLSGYVEFDNKDTRVTAATVQRPDGNELWVYPPHKVDDQAAADRLRVRAAYSHLGYGCRPENERPNLETVQGAIENILDTLISVS